MLWGWDVWVFSYYYDFAVWLLDCWLYLMVLWAGFICGFGMCVGFLLGCVVMICVCLV